MVTVGSNLQVTVYGPNHVQPPILNKLIREPNQKRKVEKRGYLFNVASWKEGIRYPAKPKSPFRVLERNYCSNGGTRICTSN